MPWTLWGATLCFSLGALVILLGLAMFRAEPRQRLNRVAALMLSFGGLGVLQVGIEIAAQAVRGSASSGPSDLSRYLELLWQFFFPALLLFVLIFPQEARWYRRIPGLGALLFLPYLFHLALTVLADRSGGTFYLNRVPHQQSWAASLLRAGQVALSLLYDAHLFLFSLVNLAYVLATLILLVIRLRRAASPRLKDQLRAIAMGLGACLILYSVAEPLPNVFGLASVRGQALHASVLVLALILGSGSIAYAIVRHRFLDAGFILRRSIVFLLPALVVAMSYLLIMAAARNLFASLGSFDPRLIEPLILLLLISILQPMVERLEDFVEGYVQRDRREGRVVLQDLSKDIVTILDIERLAGRLTGAVGESLLVERCALYRRSGAGFEPLAAYDNERRVYSGAQLAEEPRLAECGALLPATALSEGPQFLRDIGENGGGGWPEGPGPDGFRVAASGLGLDLFLPIDHGGDVLGMLALGRKLTRGRFTREDLSLLVTLANQTGAAMKNAHLYSESMRNAALQEELNLARQIQFNYLPTRFPTWENLEVFGMNLPSRQVGGDY